MSKHDHEWLIAGTARATELAGSAPADPALVRFLAGADDWQIAGRQLSGAFCDDQALRFETNGKE